LCSFYYEFFLVFVLFVVFVLPTMLYSRLDLWEQFLQVLVVQDQLMVVPDLLAG
jgi:hypothetical protein